VYGSQTINFGSGSYVGVISDPDPALGSFQIRILILPAGLFRYRSLSVKFCEILAFIAECTF